MINIKGAIYIIKRVIYAFLLLFSLNVSINSFGISIPINIANVGVTSILGIPGLISIFIIKLLMY